MNSLQHLSIILMQVAQFLVQLAILTFLMNHFK